MDNQYNNNGNKWWLSWFQQVEKIKIVASLTRHNHNHMFVFSLYPCVLPCFLPLLLLYTSFFIILSLLTMAKIGQLQLTLIDPNWFQSISDQKSAKINWPWTILLQTKWITFKSDDTMNYAFSNHPLKVTRRKMYVLTGLSVTTLAKVPTG